MSVHNFLTLYLPCDALGTCQGTILLSTISLDCLQNSTILNIIKWYRKWIDEWKDGWLYGTIVLESMTAIQGFLFLPISEYKV